MPKPSAPFRPLGFFTVTTLAGSLAVVLALRPIPEASASARLDAPVVDATPLAPADPTAKPAPVPDTETSTETETSTNAASVSLATTDQTPVSAEPTPRPLRVVALGWELLTPLILANDGLEPGPARSPEAQALELHASAVEEIAELELRLARGGESETGADVALLPLPAFVASYERLRALDPQVFFVVGWSRGRDALASENSDLLVERAPRGKLQLVGRAGQSATMLSLFALEELGVDAEHIELLSPLSPEAEHTQLRAIERASTLSHTIAGHYDARELVLTSADAPRLVPIVAIAPASFVQEHTGRLSDFGRAWLVGTERFAEDVPGAARRVAQESGAPEAVALLTALAYLDFTSLDEAARIAGLAGRDALSLEHLFLRSWRLWREVGVLSTPAPEHAPLANSVLARVVLGGGAQLGVAHEAKRGGDRLLLVREFPSADGVEREALIEAVGLLAGIFERGELELRVRRDKNLSRELVVEAAERFGLDPEHLRVGPRIRDSSTAAQIHIYVP